jgi:hypothetical protein
MIIFKKTTDGTHHQYSHIECDAPGCDAVSPTAENLVRESLFARGWFVTGGKHRCPEHFHDDIQAQGPLDRAADGSEGFVR